MGAKGTQALLLHRQDGSPGRRRAGETEPKAARQQPVPQPLCSVSGPAEQPQGLS